MIDKLKSRKLLVALAGLLVTLSSAAWVPDSYDGLLTSLAGVLTAVGTLLVPNAVTGDSVPVEALEYDDAAVNPDDLTVGEEYELPNG